MDLHFNTGLATAYHSKSQIARVLTENWVAENMYCPRCGCPKIEHFKNNRPVADFYCPRCATQFELKSKSGRIGEKVNDGAYETMIERITSRENPDFLFMGYSMRTFSVNDLVLVPRHFFVPGMIEKRKPLAPTAKRAGWVGCNILLSQIPMQGRVCVICDGHIEHKNSVIAKIKQAQELRVDNLVGRGWLFDVLNCINAIPLTEFELNDMYQFEIVLAKKHPENHNIRPKIRQQLQFLRDKGMIEFVGEGKYRKRF